LKNNFCLTEYYKEKQEKLFSLFPEVACVGDSFVIPIYKPFKVYEESKEFFSGKHNIYCIKFDTSHSVSGLLVSHSELHAGAVHDINVKKTRIDEMKEFLKKRPNIKRIDDSINNNEWAEMLDSGYEGLSSEYRVITPKKKKKGLSLSQNDKEFNKKFASCRVIVENFYGRLKSSWEILNKRFKVSEEGDYKKISLIVTNCLYLTSFLVMKHPLRSEDKVNHERIVKHLQVKQHAKTEKKKKIKC